MEIVNLIRISPFYWVRILLIIPRSGIYLESQTINDSNQMGT